MDKLFFAEYSKIDEGLRDLLRSVRKYSDTYSPKLRDMESAYFKANPQLYSENEKVQLEYCRKAFSYKFYLATMYLEQIWSLVRIEKCDYQLNEILDNIFDSHKTTDNDILLLSFVVEGFIVQGNAFLDFYLLYICHIFKIEGTHRMSGEKLMRALREIEEQQFVKKAESVEQYFKEKVFGNEGKGAFSLNNWGKLLKNLRNSILHRDDLTPSFEENISLQEIVINDWHDGLKEIACSRFCQGIINDMFSILAIIAPLIYEVDWIPGPYRENMW